jgi:hypothetical protein
MSHLPPGGFLAQEETNVRRLDRVAAGKPLACFRILCRKTVPGGDQECVAVEPVEERTPDRWLQLIDALFDFLDGGFLGVAEEVYFDRY